MKFNVGDTHTLTTPSFSRSTSGYTCKIFIQSPTDLYIVDGTPSGNALTYQVTPSSDFTFSHCGKYEMQAVITNGTDYRKHGPITKFTVHKNI